MESCGHLCKGCQARGREGDLGGSLADGEQEGKNEIVHGNVSGVLLVESPGLEPYGSEAGREGGRDLTVCGWVVP